MSPNLSVVAHPAPARPETTAERVKRLQAEAKGLARDHVKSLTGLLCQVETMATEIADGGDAYPPGVRDVARQLVEDSGARAQTIEAIMSRSAK